MSSPVKHEFPYSVFYSLSTHNRGGARRGVVPNEITSTRSHILFRLFATIVDQGLPTAMCDNRLFTFFKCSYGLYARNTTLRAANNLKLLLHDGIVLFVQYRTFSIVEMFEKRSFGRQNLWPSSA